MTVRGLDTPEVRKRVAAILAQTSKRDIGPAARSLAGRVLTVRLTVQSGQPRLKETI